MATAIIGTGGSDRLSPASSGSLPQWTVVK